jgi:uncharacterized protein (DUF2249 family)
MENKNLIISPKTKVLQLIETYPELEDVLIEYVPAFSKLKNPILRKTVAKIASLQQAATIGGVKVEELINHLRKAVGQESDTFETDTVYNTLKPDWFIQEKISKSLDIREMLNRGEQPVNLVISDINQLSAGEIYEVIAPFIPAPLIDKASSLNIQHWVLEEHSELFKVYFQK